MKEKQMQTTYKLSILLLLVVLGGCISHDYTWHEYPIASDRISSNVSFTEGKEISIVKGKSDSTDIRLGKAGPHRYYGNMQSLTDGVADQLAIELRKKQLVVKNPAEKSLEVTVVRSNFESGTFAQAASMDVELKFGSGKIKSYTVRNRSPQTGIDTVNRIYNGLVALAVIQIMNDQEVAAYINQ
jgi:hypothetical protein